MKLVLQCSFCHHVLPKSNTAKMKKHEKDCISNPSFQLCHSCKHYEVGLDYGLYHTESCKKGLNISDVSDKEIPCMRHEAKIIKG